MALPNDPWEKLRQATVPAPAPAPAPQAGGGGGGGLLSLLGGGGDGGGGGVLRHPSEDRSFMDMLGQLGSIMVMMDPQTQNAGMALAQMQSKRGEERKDRRSQNETAAWLRGEGVGPGEAAFLTSHPTALNSWYTAWKNGDKPDWQIHELFNDKGQKQKFMVDMKTGNLSPLGGSEIVKPKLSIQTTYDASGNETKSLVNEDTGEIVTQIGGTKTNLLTPEELAQKEQIAAAGASRIDVGKEETEEGKTVGKGFGELYIDTQKRGRQAHTTLGTLSIMEQAAKSEGFTSGGAADFILQAKRLAKTLGWDPEGLTSTEAFSTMAKGMVFDTIGSLGTGISNADRSFIEESLPGLTTSRGGNLALIDIQRELQKRNIEVAKMARDYRKENGRLDEGFEDKLDEYATANPVFTTQKVAEILKTAQDQTMPGDSGAGGGGAADEPAGAADDFVPVPGHPGVKVRRGTTPPAVVAPVTPQPQPQVAPPEPPSILPNAATQPRVRSVQPALPQPNPQRFR